MGRSGAAPLQESLVGHHEVDQGAQGYARRTLRQPGFGVVIPGCACYVEVDPGSVAGEFADEPGSRYAAAAFAAADVLDVGEAALYEFAVFVVHGHLPHFFADGFGGGQELVGPGVVGAAEYTDVDVGQGHYDRAG